MKKIISLFLTFAFFVLCAASFVGCQKAQCPEDTKQNSQTESWSPNAEEPWNFIPVCESVNGDDYDIEFTMEQSVYSEVPEYFVCTAVNKTGKQFRVCSGLAVEKIYSDVYYSSYGEVSSAWVRIPFRCSANYGISARADMTWKIEISKYVEKDFEFTPGQYRLVAFLGDGPHYAYFEITG